MVRKHLETKEAATENVVRTSDGDVKLNLIQRMKALYQGPAETLNFERNPRRKSYSRSKTQQGPWDGGG